MTLKKTLLSFGLLIVAGVLFCWLFQPLSQKEAPLENDIQDLVQKNKLPSVWGKDYPPGRE